MRELLGLRRSEVDWSFYVRTLHMRLFPQTVGRRMSRQRDPESRRREQAGHDDFSPTSNTTVGRRPYFVGNQRVDAFRRRSLRPH